MAAQRSRPSAPSLRSPLAGQVPGGGQVQPDAEGVLNKHASTPLDANGNGQVQFGVPSAWTTWAVTGVAVSCVPGSPPPQAELFLGAVSAGFSQGATISGDLDQFADMGMIMDDGTDLYVVWTGGPAGAVAAARISGTYTTRRS